MKFFRKSGENDIQYYLPKIRELTQRLEAFGFRIVSERVSGPIKFTMSLENESIQLTFHYDTGDYYYTAYYLENGRVWRDHSGELHAQLLPLAYAVNLRGGEKRAPSRLTSPQVAQAIQEDIRKLTQFAPDILNGEIAGVADLQLQHFRLLYEQYGEQGIPNSILNKLRS
ncbi:MAG: hypothetical protein JST51_02045 [Armatimonadetes bacterium]|nr:hypothetical protein [Armatimonadota bacterium]